MKPEDIAPSKLSAKKLNGQTSLCVNCKLPNLVNYKPHVVPDREFIFGSDNSKISLNGPVDW